MTDITELAHREKFEAWWERTQHNGNPPRFGWSHWRDGEGYKVGDDDPEIEGMWSAWKAASAELVEALEKAQHRIDELENDEVRQRLANAEHQLYMAELAKHNLKASRKAQFSKRKASEKRIAELEAQNEYIRKRYQQLDLLIGKNILVMQAAIIEWQATGDAKNGLAWIYNTLFGPGELPDEAEKDAQAYFDRKYAPLDEELMALHKWFWEQSEAERAAAGIKVEAE
ncbi:TPA: ead/Ea22-like family protein [Klebsiella pneumoniae]|nr:ead/Ea22-like family protein [Klebsiella pneumoniae]HED2618225.1 ead/Ea22-like family protein [Klebsiella pneumoniae]HED2651514.1 ead/Ea22-like family protein [Klebsiella pneumoniae]HED2658369.1 ead/Ea22-like family protein [Klebsiella pneumoniae]HED3172012.1 ead/Ea22-like family protein [Klebsiella pneumoniae]